MYKRNTIFLNSELHSRLRPVLSVKLRQVRGIVSAVVEEKKVTVYYMGRLDLRALQLFVRAFEEKFGLFLCLKGEDSHHQFCLQPFPNVVVYAKIDVPALLFKIKKFVFQSF